MIFMKKIVEMTNEELIAEESKLLVLVDQAPADKATLKNSLNAIHDELNKRGIVKQNQKSF